MALEVGSDAQESWRLIKGAGKNLKTQIPRTISFLSSNSVTLEYVFDIYERLKNTRDQLDAEKTTQGLNAFVQSVRDDNSYDAFGQINVVVSEIEEVLNWVDSNASDLNLTGDSAANYLTSGSVASNRFAPGQTSGLRTRLQRIVDAINDA